MSGLIRASRDGPMKTLLKPLYDLLPSHFRSQCDPDEAIRACKEALKRTTMLSPPSAIFDLVNLWDGNAVPLATAFKILHEHPALHNHNDNYMHGIRVHAITAERELQAFNANCLIADAIRRFQLAQVPQMQDKRMLDALKKLTGLQSVVPGISATQLAFDAKPCALTAAKLLNARQRLAKLYTAQRQTQIDLTDANYGVDGEACMSYAEAVIDIDRRWFRKASNVIDLLEQIGTRPKPERTEIPPQKMKLSDVLNILQQSMNEANISIVHETSKKQHVLFHFLETGIHIGTAILLNSTHWHTVGINGRHEGASKAFPTQFALSAINSPLKNLIDKKDGEDVVLEVQDAAMLAHELFHALHHTLSFTKQAFWSGLNRIPRDTVELPALFGESLIYNAVQEYPWDHRIMDAGLAWLDWSLHHFNPMLLEEQLFTSQNILKLLHQRFTVDCMTRFRSSLWTEQFLPQGDQTDPFRKWHHFGHYGATYYAYPIGRACMEQLLKKEKAVDKIIALMRKGGEVMQADATTLFPFKEHRTFWHL